RWESIPWLEAGEQAPEAAIALVGEMKVLVPMPGLIDKHAELARRDKQRNKLRSDPERARNKPANPNFVDKAPAAVVGQERRRVADMESALATLDEQYRRISAL